MPVHAGTGSIIQKIFLAFFIYVFIAGGVFCKFFQSRGIIDSRRTAKTFEIVVFEYLRIRMDMKSPSESVTNT
jgi:hypothetical protein